jgi:DNA-binding beta-propeller fold protein YncE
MGFKPFIYLFILFVLSSTIYAQRSEYTTKNKFHVDGDEFWDCISVDETTNRLYISHGSVAQVLDAASGNLLGTISGLNGVHGVISVPELGKGFITSGRDSMLVVFDLQSFNVLDRINVGAKGPDILIYDAFSKMIFTFNGGSNSATAIDASGNIVKQIDLGGKPEFAVTDGKGNVYVNIEDKSQITQFSSKTFEVQHSWPISPGESPSGLAFDGDTHRLFAVCENSIMVVVNADNGSVITTIPTGKRTDGAAFDSKLKRIYSSNGEGTLTVVQENSDDTYTLVENVPTQISARTCAVNSKTHHIYLPAADFDPPPAPTNENPNPRPKIKPGTFVILDVEYSK